MPAQEINGPKNCPKCKAPFHQSEGNSGISLVFDVDKMKSKEGDSLSVMCNTCKSIIEVKQRTLPVPEEQLEQFLGEPNNKPFDQWTFLEAIELANSAGIEAEDVQRIYDNIQNTAEAEEIAPLLAALCTFTVNVMLQGVGCDCHECEEKADMN